MLTILKKQYSSFAAILIISALILLHIAFNYNLEAFPEIWLSEAPFSKWFALTFPILLKTKLFTFSVSLLIIAIQTFLVYRIAESVRQIDEYSLLFSWVYVWLIHAFPEFHSFSPSLISSTFLLAALYLFLKNANLTHSSKHYFYIGFLIGLASLFTFSSILILLLFIIIQALYNVIKVKTGIIIALSALVIVLDFYLLQYFTNSSIHIIDDFKNLQVQLPSIKPLNYLQIILPLFLLLITLIGLAKSYALSSKINQSGRLFLNFILFLSLTLSLGMFLNQNSVFYSLTPILFSVAVYFSLSLNIFKRPLFNELMHIVVILLIITNHYIYSLSL